ncbi:FAD-dependent oxidoreductase [Rhodoferax sp. TH121]|uniref:NAD(P)/FAD-dependent oxidoreductase n=1 Tax=Rhodoferax sp. TH121 TaxID=2022803 RepID=UPI000B96FC99|nr:NAD(P)/FAD-dependent oxidoreductase [Rhodoferax sp. TH121]OYQ40887.1 FAD-dependent oxidoreductase [Rhodoferax sp. TH121]
MTIQTPAARARVVIIGCGFGGLEATKALRQADVDITVVDKHNHHLFQPLLYQVATAGLTAPAIAEPIRRIFRKQRNVTVLMAEVTGVDAQTRSVFLNDGQVLPYDHLIVAAGATHSYFGHDDWAAHAPGLKTLEDAFVIRHRLLMAYEAAERLPPQAPAEQRDALLTSVVIGAGPTGVEMAGTMVEIARHTLKGEFRRFQSQKARVLLIEGGARVLGNYPQALSESAKQQLEKIGVEVRIGARVTQIDAQGVTLEEGGQTQRIAAATVVWAAGVAASPLGKVVAAATGAELDRAGRVQVLPDLSLPGHPEISVVGDLAAAKSYVPGQEPTPVPGVSPGAKQMGRTAAANILRRLRGEAGQPFRYINYGDLATIGRKAAVADVGVPLLGQLRFTGFPAWLFWLFIHVFFLIGFRNRLVVMIDWAWSYWTFERHARIVVGKDET